MLWRQDISFRNTEQHHHLDNKMLNRYRGRDNFMVNSLVCVNFTVLDCVWLCMSQWIWPFKNKWKKLASHDDGQKKNVSSYGCARLLLKIRLDLKASFSLHALMENYVCITCFNGFVIVIHEKCKYHQMIRHFIPFLVSFHSQVRMCWPCVYVHVFIPVLICFLYFGSGKIDKQLKSWMRTLIISCHWVLLRGNYKFES